MPKKVIKITYLGVVVKISKIKAEKVAISAPAILGNKYGDFGNFSA